ncbi:MAG: hypothetical protein D6816_08310 [Bacteroidetes bacterium]|nr:MAG: hypothetical protein D6816_08310 [Bacteroidota bacterium]
MSDMSQSDPIALLGLIPPDEIELEDQCLADVYRQFCDSLSVLPPGDAVRIGPEPCFVSRYDQGQVALARQKLVCALLRFTRSRVKKIERRILGNDWDREEAGVIELGFSKKLRELAAFTQTRDYALLRKGTVRWAFLSEVSVQGCSMPGMDWSASIECVSWTKEWGLVLTYESARDYPSDPYEFFPYVLGFYKLDEGTFAAGRLLAHREYGIDLQDTEFWGDEELGLGWGRYEGFAPGKHVFDLDHKAYRQLYRAYNKSWLNSTFFNDAFEFWYAARKFGYSYDDNVLKILIDAYGIDKVKNLRVAKELMEENFEVKESSSRL